MRILGLTDPREGRAPLSKKFCPKSTFCFALTFGQPRLGEGEGEGEGRCKLRVCDANARPRQCQFLDKGRVKPIIGKSTLVLLYTNIHLARTNPFSQI